MRQISLYYQRFVNRHRWEHFHLCPAYKLTFNRNRHLQWLYLDGTSWDKSELPNKSKSPATWTGDYALTRRAVKSHIQYILQRVLTDFYGMSCSNMLTSRRAHKTYTLLGCRKPLILWCLRTRRFRQTRSWYSCLGTDLCPIIEFAVGEAELEQVR